MSHASPERLGPVQSLNDERLAALRALAPELFTSDNDGVNADNVLAYFGLADQPRKRESFGLDWVGKHAAIMAAGLPATHTLVPEELANSQNLIIEGDNLEVLRILRKSYANKIKLIYIDPPYNTGNDFVYPDNFATHANDYLRSVGAINAEGVAQSVNTRSDGRFHAKWLNMMYPRLVLARELLRDDGVIFVSIDDNEVHNLRAIMNEVFGEENFVGNIAWESKTKSQNTRDSYNKLQPKIEYILTYTKSSMRRFNLVNLGEKEYPFEDSVSVYREYMVELMNADGVRGRETMIYSIEGITPPSGKQWKLGLDTINEYRTRGDLFIRAGKVFLKMRPNDEKSEVTEPFWGFVSKEYGTAESAKKELSKILENDKHGFETVKPASLIQKLVFHTTSNDDVVLDFFAGSGTTAHAVMSQNTVDGMNRKFILVQLPEQLSLTNPEQALSAAYCQSIKAPRLTIAEITKERVRRAAAKIRSEHPMFAGDLGFSSYKLAPSHLLDIPKQVVSDQAQITSFLFPDRLVPQWTPDGLYTELLLREGFLLTTPFTTVGDWRVYVHDNGVALYINVALKTSATELLRVLEARDRDGKRKRNGVAICLDGALTDAELQHLHEHVFLKTV